MSATPGAARFRSKVDTWILALIALPIGLTTLLGAGIAISQRDPNAFWLLGSGPFLCGFILLVAWPMDYDLDARGADGEPQMLIRSGLFRFRVPIEGIRSVKRTSNPLSSPAWSLDRLWIDYVKGKSRTFVMISPDQQSAFLDELLRRAPQLVRRGDQLVSHCAEPDSPPAGA
jgi:hypothetical protein